MNAGKNQITTVKAALASAIETKVYGSIDAPKTREAQKPLAAKNFTSRDNYRNYIHATNKFVLSAIKHINDPETISKRELTRQINYIGVFLSTVENVRTADRKPYVFESAHTNFILTHIRATLKFVKTDSDIRDIISTINTETAARKLIELCFYMVINGLPVPTSKISEKAQERMDKNAQKLSAQDINATMVNMDCHYSADKILDQFLQGHTLAPLYGNTEAIKTRPVKPTKKSTKKSKNKKAA